MTTFRIPKQLLAAVLAVCAGFATPAHAAPPTRGEVIEIAHSFAEHRWNASPQNVLHGLDRSRVKVHTPDAREGSGWWKIGDANVGMPYKWGGFDSLESFQAGIRAGKAAGDLYSSEKRRQGGAAVSSAAVGVDCSGFISRCWKLPAKRGTATLPELCRALGSPQELQPGDIMNVPGGHVVLFAEWLNSGKSRALFYEAEPFSKVVASEYEVASLSARGFRPWRYRQIRN